MMTDSDALGIVKRCIEENVRPGVTVEQICAMIEHQINTGRVSLSIAPSRGDGGLVYACTFYGPSGSILCVP